MPTLATKRRVICGSRSEAGVESTQTLATATATAFPTAFPPVPDASNRKVFAGDMQGCKVMGARWSMSTLTTFTAADATLQHSPDGTNWSTVDGSVFTQKTGTGSEQIVFTDLNADKGFRFWRVLLDMTGIPGTSEHLVELLFQQCGPRGVYAPPGAPVHT